jgi:hypothetical protein
MQAQLIRHIKAVDDLGNIIEIKMWKLPEPVADKPHGYKYSLVYIVDDVRLSVMTTPRAEETIDT